MSLRPNLQRIALSLAVAVPCIAGVIDDAAAQRAASSKAAAPKGGAASSETDRVLDGAAKSLQAGNADAAMTALDGALSGGGLSNNHMARALYLRGLAHRAKGRPAQAMADLTSAIWIKDGLSEADRTAALNARSEVTREVGLPAQAAGGGSSGGSAGEARPAPSVAAAEAPPSAPRARTAAAPRSSGNSSLSEAGFIRAFPPAAPAASETAQATGPATSSWESGTRVDGSEPHQSTEARSRVAARSDPPPTSSSARASAPQPSGSGLGSFFSGLFSGTNSPPSPPAESRRDPSWSTSTRAAERRTAAAESPARPKASTIATSAVPSGAFRLQVATVRSRKEADAVAARFRKEHAGVVGVRTLEIDEAAFGSTGTYFRVRLGPYANVSEPKALCDQLRPKGFDCLVVTN